MEQLAPETPAEAQSGSGGDGGGLKMDAQASPAEQECGEDQGRGVSGEDGHGPHAGGELQRADQHGAEKLRREADRLRTASGRGIRKTERLSDGEKRGEKDHISADAQQRRHRRGQRAGQRLGEGKGRGLSLRYAVPPDAAAPTDPQQQRAQRVDAPERETDRRTAEHPEPQSPDGEGWTGVVAEPEEILGLLPPELPRAECVGHRRGAERISPGEPQKEDPASGGINTQQLFPHRDETAARRFDDAEPRQQAGGGKVGQQRGDQKLRPKPKSRFGAGACLRGKDDERSEEAQGPENRDPLFFHGNILCPPGKNRPARMEIRTGTYAVPGEVDQVKIRDSVADLSDALVLPPEALTSAAKITLFGRRQAVVEHHAGLLGYTTESVEVALVHDRVRVLGAGLTLKAMDKETLLVTGRIAAVEYG